MKDGVIRELSVTDREMGVSNPQEPMYEILPVYLVLDTSYSMKQNGAFEAAFDFVPQLLDVFDESAMIAETLRVEIITFDETADAPFKLGDADELKQWYEEKLSDPIIPDGSKTYYSVAFAKIRERIQEGYVQTRENRDGIRPHRPLVFFITDGMPTEKNKRNIDNTFNKLTEDNFKMRPNIVVIGVGDATKDRIAPYAAGKMGCSSYTKGNENMVIAPESKEAQAEALKNIIPDLINSVVASVNKAGSQKLEVESGGITDPFRELQPIASDLDFDALLNG